MIAVLLLIILQSLSSVLCLKCTDLRQNNGLGVHVKRDEISDRSYWLYDRNGSEWRFTVEEINGKTDIDFDNKTVSYDRTIVNRFSNYFEYEDFFCINNCAMNINSTRIVCRVNYTSLGWSQWEVAEWHQTLDIENPLVFKPYPKEDSGLKATYLMAYNRHNKSDRVRLRMVDFDDASPKYGVYVETEQIEDIQFIREMKDNLFSQIDSIIDYDLDEERALTGHMLWFNIDHKYYYCFQPEGQPLSEQCSSKEKLNMALKECNFTNETTVPTKGTTNENIWQILAIIIITVVVIAVIVGVMFVLRRKKGKPETTSSSYITSTKNSLPQFQKGSITKDIDRYHNRFIQSNTESTATSKTSAKSGTKTKGIAKGKKLIKTSNKKGNKSVSPLKKVKKTKKQR